MKAFKSVIMCHWSKITRPFLQKQVLKFTTKWRNWHQLPFSGEWLLNPSSKLSKVSSGKCKRCLKFTRNDQIIAKSGYSAACPVLCTSNLISPASSSGSTSLLAGVDAILIDNNIRLYPDHLLFAFCYLQATRGKNIIMARFQKRTTRYSESGSYFV